MPTERTTLQQSKRQAPLGLVVIAVILLALSPALTKAGGLLFFVFIVWGVWAVLRWPRFEMESTLALDWLIVATAALVFRAAATVWWSDSWGGRHFEGRFFLMALAAWCLFKTCSLASWHKDVIDVALALACWVALAVVWMVGRDTPTNALPWAAGVSFLVCVLLGRLFEPNRSWAVRSGLLVSGVGGVAAVLLSQSRGSYGVAVWLVGTLVLMSWFFALKRHGSMVWRSAAVVILGIAALATAFPQLYRAPQERMQMAVQEAGKLTDELRRGQVSVSAVDTSVGARLYMWVRALDEPGVFAVTGIGERQRQAWVKDLGRESGSEVIASLDHLHSDPLTIWFEHGLLGLASYLSVALGLLWLAWRARVLGAGAVMALGGIAFMHITAGLTNFNTGHNFYGVMLSLCTLLAVWLAVPASREAGA
jgi:O-antigen ligase